MTARVMMNRIWQHHFGVGIVGTSNDFGAMGDEPTHPELLDWLAVEFVDRGWSQKAMHRLIVTSAAYQQSSLVDPDSEANRNAIEADPQNNLLWHFRRQRLDGESIRDAMLAVSQQLSDKMYAAQRTARVAGGFEIELYLEGRRKARGPQSPLDLRLRGATSRLPMLESFDLPDMHNSCARRANTTTARRRWCCSTANSPWIRRGIWLVAFWPITAIAKAKTPACDCSMRSHLAACPTSTRAQKQSLSSILSRKPSPHRASKSKKSCYRSPMPLAALEPAPVAAAFVDLCHAILNSNEFFFVD